MTQVNVLLDKLKNRRVQQALALIALGCAILVLILLFITSSVNASAVRQDLRRSRNTFAGRMQSNVSLAVQVSGNMLETGADVEGSLLKQLETYVYTVSELNDAITTAYGAEYTPLAEKTLTTVSSGIDEVKACIEIGKNYSTACTLLNGYLMDLQSELLTRFSDSGELLAA